MHECSFFNNLKKLIAIGKWSWRKEASRGGFAHSIKAAWLIAMYTFLVVALFSFISIAQAKPLWITSSCFSLNMSVFDKLGSSKNEHIVFHVISSDGTVYVSKRITSNIGDVSVSFPKDFIYEKAQLPANIDCNNASKYDWKILVENNLIDSGTVEFKRNKLK